MSKLLIVIPCYNESGRLPTDQLGEALDRYDDIAFYLVDDGSRDRTHQVLLDFARASESRVHVHRLEENRGKGEAVRAGVSEGTRTGAEHIAYCDADLAVPVSEIVRLRNTLEAASPRELLMGSRIKLLGKKIQRSGFRHVQGRVFSTLASLILDLPVYDTQCGGKVMTSDLATKLFAEPLLTRWCFDIEIILRLRQLVGKERLSEIAAEEPLLQWMDQPGSRVRFHTPARMFRELWRLRAAYTRK